MDEVTTTATIFSEPAAPSKLSGGSIVLGSPSKRAASLISKSYKQASVFFLTRRLLEAFSVLEPIVCPDRRSNYSEHDATDSQALPITGASRDTRIKVWNLYLTLLNTIVELEPNFGMKLFGNRKWREIVTKVREGSIWEEVVQVGYRGIEGTVDAEVVTCLVTLLLAQCLSQETNQQRLESYLLGSGSSIDSSSFLKRLSERSELSAYSIKENRTDTPESLNSRVKIIELYVLHVLPRNGEWQYARDLISMSEILDEGRKEAFLHALEAFEAERNKDDYQGMVYDDQGRESTQTQPGSEAQGHTAPNPSEHSQSCELEVNSQVRVEDANNCSMEKKSITKGLSRSRTDEAQFDAPIQRSTYAKISTSARPRSTMKKSPTTSIYVRGMAALQRLVINMTQAMSTQPTILLKTILFLVGIMLTLGRRDVRHKISGVSRVGWTKIRETIGMGVKVSYI